MACFSAIAFPPKNRNVSLPSAFCIYSYRYPTIIGIRCPEGTVAVCIAAFRALQLVRHLVHHSSKSVGGSVSGGGWLRGELRRSGSGIECGFSSATLPSRQAN